MVTFTKFTEYLMFVTVSSTCHKCVNRKSTKTENTKTMSLCPHIDMRWQASDPQEPLLGLLTSPCSDLGQNYLFLGSHYRLSGAWLFLKWSPRASADDVKLCPTPCPIWLITSRGLLYTSEVEMISIHESDCSSFVQHFHLGLRICPFCCSSPITQYVVWHAAKCKWLFTPALLVVAMVCLLYQGNKIHGNR